MSGVQPRRDDSGNEELGAVARMERLAENGKLLGEKILRVRASIGHGQQTGLVVLQLEVLVGELLSVDRLATSALHCC